MLILVRRSQICNTLIVSTLASCQKLPATVPDLADHDIELEEGRPRTEAYIVYLFLMLSAARSRCCVKL